jgi:anti-anti-sigma factor
MPILKLLRDPYVELEEALFQLNELLPRDAREMVVDLGNVARIDSMIVGKLVNLHLALEQRRVRLRLVQLSPQARQVIHHAHLDSVFGLNAPEPPRFDRPITSH